MRDNPKPTTKSKLNLLAAAEHLLADRGFDSVSVRDITQRAKANVAAVNYHFGSREGILGLVVARYLEPVNADRLARLDNLEKKWGSKSVPLEELMDACLRPLSGLGRSSDLAEWQLAALMGRILALPESSLPESLAARQDEVSGRYLKALGKSLATVDRADLAWRLHFAVGSVIRLLIAPDASLVTAGGGIPTLEAGMSKAIQFAVAGMREGVAEPPARGKKGPQGMFDF